MVSNDEWKLGAISPLILDGGGAHCDDDGYVSIIVSMDLVLVFLNRPERGTP